MQCLSACRRACWQVRMCSGISSLKRSNRGKLLLRWSLWRLDLHVHRSFKATVNESHLFISPERICNFGSGAYSVAAFVKNLLVWILWILISPEMTVAVICSYLRWAHGGSTGFFFFFEIKMIILSCISAIRLQWFWIITGLLRCSGGPVALRMRRYAIKEWILYFMLDLSRLFSSFKDVMHNCIFFLCF